MSTIRAVLPSPRVAVTSTPVSPAPSSTLDVPTVSAIEVGATSLSVTASSVPVTSRSSGVTVAPAVTAEAPSRMIVSGVSPSARLSSLSVTDSVVEASVSPAATMIVSSAHSAV